MRYALIHSADPARVPATPEQIRAVREHTASWTGELDTAGVRLHGSRLHPDYATTVRVRDGRTLISDGPFAETKEQVAGYDVLECGSLDEAVRHAARHPAPPIGATEVRAFPVNAPGGRLPEPAEGRTRYLMLVLTDPSAGPAVFEDLERPAAWAADADSRGLRVFGSELEPPETARTLRKRDGNVLVTDGPFTEAKEQIAGFDLLDCADLDEALEVAARHPMARGGILELRPLWDGDDPANHLPV